MTAAAGLFPSLAKEGCPVRGGVVRPPQVSPTELNSPPLAGEGWWEGSERLPDIPPSMTHPL